jgi:nitroreductase
MLLMREPDAFALGFQRRQILPGFAVAPRATFAKRRQYFKYVIIDYQGLIAAIRCALPQVPIRADSDRLDFLLMRNAAERHLIERAQNGPSL